MKNIGRDDEEIGVLEQWITLIIKCVASVSYSVLINGQPGSSITPTKGIYLGDLIYPYLYLICVEGFSALLNEA